jgi:hypothetical protein
MTMPNTPTAADAPAYQERLLNQLKHVEETVNKFAIQNYVSCGAVILSYLTTDKPPLVATTILGSVVAVCFTIGIGVQLRRAWTLYVMQCIARDFGSVLRAS